MRPRVHEVMALAERAKGEHEAIGVEDAVAVAGVWK